MSAGDHLRRHLCSLCIPSMHGARLHGHMLTCTWQCMWVCAVAWALIAEHLSSFQHPAPKRLGASWQREDTRQPAWRHGVLRAELGEEVTETSQRQQKLTRAGLPSLD